MVFLAAHPLCDRCSEHGRTQAASVVNHIRPHKGDPELFWDEANWEPLCKPCHDAIVDEGDFGRWDKKHARA